MWFSLLSGFFTSLSLILAIGAQNAFVLRQGLRREHVGLVVAVCALSDAALIALGVSGVGVLLPAVPWLASLLLWASVLFLFGYGALRFRAAWRGGTNKVFVFSFPFAVFRCCLPVTPPAAPNNSAICCSHSPTG